MNTQSVQTHVGEIQTELRTPTRESAQKLHDEFDYVSAVNAYVWGMPAVNQAGYIFAWRDFFKAQCGQFIALPTLQDRRGTLTPTTTSTYVLAVADLAETGPLVLEDLPGNNVGIISDLWQRLIAQIGFAGPFKGKGGRFHILGPGHEPPEDVSGYHVVRSLTNHIFFGTRLLDDDKEKAIREQAPLLQAYPYGQRENPRTKPLILGNSRK